MGDTPIDCAEFITESTHMSQRNAFNKDILNSMVILHGYTGIQMMNISMKMAGSQSPWSPQQKEQLHRDLNGQKLTSPTNPKMMMHGHSRILWRFQSPLNLVIMFYLSDGIARILHKFGMHVQIFMLSSKTKIFLSFSWNSNNSIHNLLLFEAILFIIRLIKK